MTYPLNTLSGVMLKQPIKILLEVENNEQSR